MDEDSGAVSRRSRILGGGLRAPRNGRTGLRAAASTRGAGRPVALPALARIGILLGIALGGARASLAGGAGPWPRTPNEFLGQGLPTFVRGTAGDDAADARVAIQVELLRGMLFPTAAVVDDVSIDPTKGPSAWPRNPVLFGGSHVNALVKAVEADLPFRVDAGRVTAGDRTFEGTEFRLVAVAPPREAAGARPAHPGFLLYAGAGMPGITEINSVPHGGDSVLVMDRFGALAKGRWEVPDGKPPWVDFATPAPRKGWMPGAPSDEPSAAEFFHLRRSAEPGLDVVMAERQQEQACLAGIEAARAKLALPAVAPPLRVYLYPDARVKREWTGRGGDGHVDLLSRSVHVRTVDVSNTHGLERLVAHEATHLLVEPVATSLIGEGLAVWVSGTYGGRPLAEWKGKVPKDAKLEDLLSGGFRRLPEQASYPLAGFLVTALVDLATLEGVKAHFLLATRATWADACKAAGTTPEEVEKAWRTSL